MTKQTLLLSSLCLITLTALLSFGFFFHIDITDEGFHYYLNQFGLSDQNGILTYQVIPHIIGKFFNYSALGFRFTTLTLNLLFATYVAFATHQFFKAELQYEKSYTPLFYIFSLLGSFNFFIAVASFDYNFSVVLSAYLWLGSFLLLYTKNHTFTTKLLFLVLLTLASIWGSLAKFTFGIPLLFSTPFLIIILNILYKKKWFTNLSLLLICYLIFVPFTLWLVHINYPTYWANYISLFNIFLHMPGAGDALPKLILTYILQSGWYILMLLVRGWGIILFIALYYFKKIHAQNATSFKLHGLVYFIIVGTTLYAFYRFTPFNPLTPVEHPAYALTKFWPVAILLLWIPQWKIIFNRTHPNILIFLGLSIFSACLTPLGSNTNYLDKISLLGAFWGASLSVWILIFVKNHPKTVNTPLGKTYIPLIVLSLTSIIGTAVLHERILYAGRSAAFQNQTEKLTFSIFKGIHTTPDLKNTLTELKTQIDSSSFDPSQDRVFAYADIPGYLAILNLPAFAESWTITGYPNSDMRACTYINREPYKPTRFVYILMSMPFSPAVENCLWEKIETTTETKTYPTIKAGYHYRMRHEHTLTFSGPYKIKEN